MKTPSVLLILSFFSIVVVAQEKNAWDRQVFFGEQHLHTMESADAFSMGTRNTQDDAYNYLKGKPITKKGVGYATAGKVVQKRTPYDWGATTDHAYLMGMLPLALDPNSVVAKSEVGKLIATGKPEDMDKAFGIMMAQVQMGKTPEGFEDPKIQKSAWERIKATSNKHYEPGKFTTLVAFEWTSLPQGQNLHRNVFFRDMEGPEVPFSSVDSDKAEDLWTYLEVQRAMGHECFAIPHNGNVSNSMMYATTTTNMGAITTGWARRRALNEVATEIIQCKGQSETHPGMSPNDEFASFEIFPTLLGSGGVTGRIDHSYVRQALTNGVGFQEMIGANPFKFGIVSGSDSHTAFNENEEFNYNGVHGVNDDSPERRLSGAGQTAGEPAMKIGTHGVTAVWADENTREGIFDGIKRKETYGTSGTFIRLRFFGGWNYASDIIETSDFVKQAYQQGVPMGSDLLEKPSAAKAPTFIVWAVKDPESGNLDRVQIVKGWYQGGHPFEKVYDVVWSDNRKPDPVTGKLPPVGNTVNLKKASYTNDIGDTQLSTVWTDPDFDPSQHAVYYVRVLEIPTPRWSTYDAVSLGIDVPEGIPATIQERAWSSPIWYTPAPELVKKAGFYPGLIQRVH